MKKKITIEVPEKLKVKFAKKCAKAKTNMTQRLIELITQDLKV